MARRGLKKLEGETLGQALKEAKASPVAIVQSDVRIMVGDVFAQLALLEDESVDCVVTSPPYYGLRDYGTGEWTGGDEACDHRSPTMRDGRDEARATMPGSVATNSYQLVLAHNAECGRCGAIKVDQQIGLEANLDEHIAVLVDVFREVRRVLKKNGTLWLNYGDAYASSVNGRSAADTKAAGKDDRTFRDKPLDTVKATGLKPKDLMGLPWRIAFALQADGWWLRSDIIWHKLNPMPESIRDRPTKAHEYVFLLTKSDRYYYDADAIRQRDCGHGSGNSFVGRQGGSPRAAALNGGAGSAAPWEPGLGANARSVWPIATQPFVQSHFATMPEELAERCILAGCPPGGLVLDPFGGAGTTGLVAARCGRSAILIELNPDYAAIASRRLKAGLVRVEGGDSRRGLAPLPLLDGGAP